MQTETATTVVTKPIAAPKQPSTPKASKSAPVMRQAAVERPVSTPKPVPSEKIAERSASTEKQGSANGAWVVQLGVFATRANADRLVQELKSKGFHVSMAESSGSGGRVLYRVRAGGAADREAAEQLNAKLRAAGHPGSVVPR